MPLTVLNVACPLAPVGPDAVGGAEQILSALDEGLVRAGHRSLVVACEGSRTEGELLPIPAVKGPLDARATAEARRRCLEAMGKAIARGVDVVHVHGVDFHQYLPPGGPPLLATLHLPPSWYPAEVFAPARAETHLACVSRSQLGACPPSPALLGVVPNGVAVERLRPRDRKSGFALSLGRICPEKGYHLALDACDRAGVPLVLGGQVFGYEEHEAYFRDQLAPRLARGPHRFVGPVGLARKRRLLAAARCLIVPSLVAETSSLVAMEALSCGTPVVAMRSGALPEIVEHGVTGLIVDRPEDLADAVAEAGRLSPRACREAAVERFASSRMVSRYLDLYASIAPGRSGGRRPRGRSPSPRCEASLVSPGELGSLSGEWQALYDRCPAATTFQRPSWLRAWLAAFEPSEPRIVAVRAAGRLVGLLPLVRYHRQGVATLGLLGGGVSDYLDVLLEPGAEREAWASALSLLGSLGGWAEMRLESLSPASPLLSALPPAGFADAIEQVDACPGVVLPPGSDLSSVASPRRIETMRHALRRATRANEVSFAFATRETLGADLETFFALHGARWAERGEPGALGEERGRRFHREASKALLDEGVLRLGVLRLGDHPVAAALGYVERGSARYHLGGFDPALSAMSPGTLAVGLWLEAAVAEGCRELDLLRGREVDKYGWGAADRPLFSRVLGRASG